MNIWQIKNRWLRAAVAWVAACVGAVIVLIVLPIVLVAIAVGGLIWFVRLHWPLWRDEIFAPLWRALTAREAA